MTIMQSCCCFSTVRSGSQACGVYSLITSIIYLATWSFGLSLYVTVFNETGLTGPGVDAVYATYSINIVVTAFLLIASILLLVGISYDSKAFLIPYMVAITALMALEAIAWAIIFIILGLESGYLIANLVVWLLFTALNIACLLCVISQYQELQAGRGRANVV